MSHGEGPFWCLAQCLGHGRHLTKYSLNTGIKENLSGFEIYLHPCDGHFTSCLSLFFPQEKVGYIRTQRQKEKRKKYIDRGSHPAKFGALHKENLPVI